MSQNWNEAYTEGNTPWDKGYASKPLQAFLKTHHLKGKVLVPDCCNSQD